MSTTIYGIQQSHDAYMTITTIEKVGETEKKKK